MGLQHGYRLERVNRITDISARDWDRCAGTDSPFTCHAFLSAMERSGSVSPATGWDPEHLLLIDRTGTLQACAPVYRKSHSFGEYVFDWSWADAWRRSGRPYYPKLQCAVPFTPATGRRLLVSPDSLGCGLDLQLADALCDRVERERWSGAHITFPCAEELPSLQDRGWLLRVGLQYHWHNPGYRDFQDFLDALASRKRKAIRKERQRSQEHGVEIHCLTGNAITETHWDAFYQFYLATIEKKWAHAYLTRAFFSEIGSSMADKIVLMMAERDGQWVAGALNFRSDHALFGRNWGALGDYRDLHFEMCYYRAIDFAIAHRLDRVEAGAQGEHKISRGYLPTRTYSLHWIRETPFRTALSDVLDQEGLQVEQVMAELAHDSPFRQDGDLGPGHS